MAIAAGEDRDRPRSMAAAAPAARAGMHRRSTVLANRRVLVPRHALDPRHGGPEGSAAEQADDRRLLAPAPWPGGAPGSTRVPPADLTRRMHVAVVGEGAYPYGPGGVSLWCHQLIEGMPEHSFTAVALTVDGTERPAWERPGNLEKVVNIPLWGFGPVRRPRRGHPTPGFVAAHRAFLHAFVPGLWGPSAPGDGGSAFEDALRQMTETARGGDLGAELASDGAVQRLLEAWRDTPGGQQRPLSLREAVVAAARVEHMLRPLSHPPVAADICHLSMNGLSSLVAMRSKWSAGTPVVLSEHGVYLRERYLGLATDDASRNVTLLTVRFHRALAGAGYRIADILAPHSAFNRRWQDYGGGEPDRIETVYNGIDPADFPAAPSEPDEPTIVFVGRVDPLKDLHTLIRAFALVRTALPGARLRMFGPVTPENEEYHRSCLDLIDQLWLTGAATFEGRVPNTVDAYRAGHLVALTSVSEGFPFTVVESMSVGRPQVATDVGGVAEAIGDAGLVVPARDYQAVAEACLTLLGDPAMRREMGERARDRVLDQFTRRQWTDAYRDIYAGLAPAPGPRPVPPGHVAADRPLVPGRAGGLAPASEVSA